MDRAVLRKNINVPIHRMALVKSFCTGKDVLDVGCVNHDIGNITHENWQHGAIKSVALNLLGIDYLKSEVDELAKQGYRVLAADVTKPIEIDEQFDVIVVGNLIEHLSNFEGLMLNLERLLRPGGCLLISTPNPFFREQYFYSAFKNDIVVNPEHTCWLDPVTLDQLAQRFGLVTKEVYWIKEKWKLGQVLLNGDSRSLDIFTGQWNFHGSPSILERIIAPVLEFLFKILLPKAVIRRVYAKHGSLIPRLLYLRFMGPLLELMWRIYRMLVVTAPINKHELFVSVLKRQS